MWTEGLAYTPPEALLRRVRLFFLRTAWHGDLMERLWQEAQKKLESYSFPPERLHLFTVPGSFELVHLTGAIVRRYVWRQGFAQAISVKGPTQIQSNLRLPPFFQGNFDSQLRSEFLLESPGPIAYFQPYDPGPEGELPVVVSVGCILRGATEHHRYLSDAVITNLAYLNATSGVPIILGVLTPDTLKQAWERVHQAQDWIISAFMTWEARLEVERLAISSPSAESPSV
ncbi:MAG: 6,7-dimethyl-8-ribityllumazine synthase [Bacteroidia bacterium]|nr:6,7-dimethyl-8-ribityllumazine synthase [Bacteroidia bacterium]